MNRLLMWDSSGADDERPYERRRFWKLLTRQRDEVETSGSNRVDGGAIAVAAVPDDSSQPIQSILPAGKSLILRANVFHEQQPAARLVHPAHFSQRAGGVGHRA